MKPPTTDDKHSQCNLVRQEIYQLKEEISHWQNLNLINEENEENKEGESTKTADKGQPYSNKIREAVYACLACNVSRNNISSLIKYIIQIFTGHKLEKMPSEATIFNMSKEAGIISNKQLKEAVEESKDITLLRDATTKRGHHYYGTKINTNNKEYTLGKIMISSTTKTEACHLILLSIQ